MVTNRVYKVLVTTGGAAAATVAALTAGQWIIVKKDGTPYVATDTITQGDKFRIVVAAPDGTRIFSDLISLKDVKAYEKQVYRARVEQVVTVTLATPVAGIEYTVSVIDKSDKEILQARQNKRTYTVVAATGETATTLTAKFVTQINADVASTVTASGTTTLVLTAKSVAGTADIVGDFPAQYFFEVFSSSLDNTVYPIPFPTQSGTVVYTTAVDYGSGNYAQIRKLETRGIGYTGVTNRTSFPIETGQFLSVAGTNYDVYILEEDHIHDTNSVVEGEKAAARTTIIAITAGQGTAFEAVLTPYIASEPAEGLGVDG